MHLLFPTWTLLPFTVLVLGIAILPLWVPHLWELARFQALFALSCATPVVWYCLTYQRSEPLASAMTSYASFVLTIAALYVTASGIFVAGDIEASPRNNLAFILIGAVLASVIGTTGASILLIRPLLRTNRQRERRAHLVPFFILAVSNAGGLLTPLGDPPLLIGYLQGVPFFWTLRLFPYWLLYVGGIAGLCYWAERRAYAGESPSAKLRDRLEVEPLSLHGRYNLVLLLLIVLAVLLPRGTRELAMLAIGGGSYVFTSDAVHRKNEFSFAPIREVAILFAGLFACLSPIEVNLAAAAPGLPLRAAWQLFWGSGVLSAVLDNAPTYAAFTALARGLSHGESGLVAGVQPLLLAAISVGSVVMGASTYIGNGPNLMVKAIAERFGFAMPSFGRYALFAVGVLLPMHLVTTLALTLLER
jgi:Na+/H+ antiporter NhaD/arsenite permease-like protein